MRSIMGQANIITGDGVVIEDDARRQLARVANLEGCCRAVGMPDLHEGPGIPIGAAFAFDHVRPLLVGGDAGCGARVSFVRPKRTGDALLRRVEQEFEGPPLPGLHFEEALGAIAQHGARGLAMLEGVPETLRELAAEEPVVPPLAGPVPEELLVLASTLGTIGGGNHFAEISRVDKLVDRAEAKRLGARRDSYAVLVHSGSRGLGAALMGRFKDFALPEEDAGEYRHLLELCVRFAQANRLALSHRLLAALGCARAHRVHGAFDVTHNDVRKELVDDHLRFVHRKGCAPAPAGEPTVVLGSRGTRSWVLRGAGSAASLCSVAHGAGRRIGRSDARARFSARHRKKDLLRTDLGGWVLCDDKALLFEEHPDAYKPIEPVVASLVEAGAGTRVLSLCPVITVKK